jgi:alkylation response protein AidB-like acyl-CoA dehydrogenase
MAMILTEEQRMLADTVRPFLAERASVAHLRALRDAGDPEGFSRDLWRGFAEMGLAGVLVPEAFGGIGLGQVEAGVVLEEIGRNLTPSPFLATAVGAALVLRHASSATQQRWLPRIAAGEVTAAIALEESARHRPERVALSAKARDGGFVLSGAKRFVVQGARPDLLIVVARTSGAPEDEAGLTLFAVEGNVPGLTVDTERTVDSGMAAHLLFDDVQVSAEAVLGTVGEGRAVLGPLLTALRTGAAGELVGLGRQAFDMTVAYLRERKQFGRAIGSFQALQHRAAHLYTELEIAGAAVLKAQQLIDAGDPGAQRAAMVAKGFAGSASALAVQEGVQMHGGMGMTDEHDIGLYMKRQRVLAELYGDADYHADALARRGGY